MQVHGVQLDMHKMAKRLWGSVYHPHTYLPLGLQFFTPQKCYPPQDGPVQVHGVQLDVEKMAKRLWGDVYYHPDTRTFKKEAHPGAGGEATRTFVEFILEPLYKIYSQVSFQAAPCTLHTQLCNPQGSLNCHARLSLRWEDQLPSP